MQTIILASKSPRRRELLKSVKIPFKVLAPDLTEDFSIKCKVKTLVTRLARRKVEAVINQFKDETPQWVLGVDTVVVLNGKIMGQPRSIKQAEIMLKTLNDKKHEVISGICLYSGKNNKFDLNYAVSTVFFNRMTQREIDYYLDTGEWVGAAGAYRIQEKGGFFIKKIVGSYSNVVGLPLETFYAMLKHNGYCFYKE